ncbi:MAG: hypothetical protein PHE79_05180 [Eubacteriales bacterium]|nr:hypothetical protein [Eubacteriales bacterium]
MESNESNGTSNVNIEEQLREIIEENDSIWVIAVRSFELGQNS